MFISSTYISGTYQYNQKQNLYEAKYLIKDDDFEEEVWGASAGADAGAGAGAGAGYAVIKCYQNKNLNVAKNFMLFLKYAVKIYRSRLKNEIEYQRKYNLLFKEIEKDLEKYICLI